MAGAEAAKQFTPDSVTRSRPGVSYFPKEKVNASFSKGAMLSDGDGDGNYMVHTSRRDAPGEVEIHERDSDIIYVVKGSATLISGGTLLDGKKVAENEVRGTQLNGGEAQTLAIGDVIIVPAGIPHWFREVQPPFLYYTVKVW